MRGVSPGVASSGKRREIFTEATARSVVTLRVGLGRCEQSCGCVRQIILDLTRLTVTRRYQLINYNLRESSAQLTVGFYSKTMKFLWCAICYMNSIAGLIVMSVFVI